MHGRKKVIFIIIAAAAIVAVGIAAFVISQKSSAPARQPDKTQKPQTDLSKVNALLIPPSNEELAGYRALDSPEGYLEYETLDKACSFALGIRSRSQQPGSDLADMVARLGESQRQKGREVQSPIDGEAFQFADENDPSVTYPFPTKILHIHIPSSDTTAIEHFSAVILKSGDRLNIVQICNSQPGETPEVLQLKLKSITATLSHSKIRVTDQ